MFPHEELTKASLSCEREGRVSGRSAGKVKLNFSFTTLLRTGSGRTLFPFISEVKKIVGRCEAEFAVCTHAPFPLKESSKESP